LWRFFVCSAKKMCGAHFRPGLEPLVAEMVADPIFKSGDQKFLSGDEKISRSNSLVVVKGA